MTMRPRIAGSFSLAADQFAGDQEAHQVQKR
jgi:hypothetical protein